MRTSYAVLTVLFVVCIAWAILQPGPRWADDLAPNLAAEVAGIVLVVALIDRVIQRKELRDSNLRRTQAFRRLKVPIRRHYGLLFSMYKAAAANAPGRQYRDIDFFDQDYVETVRHLDFAAKAPVGPRRMNWFDYAAAGFEAFMDALHRTLDVYGAFLPAEDVVLIEDALTSELSMIVTQARVIPQVRAEYGHDGPDPILLLMREQLSSYVDAFARVVVLYNEHVEEGNKVRFPADPWRDDVSPKVGEARSVVRAEETDGIIPIEPD